MTAKSDFDDQQWKLIAEGPMTAGMVVLTAEHGGSFKETFAISHAYADARQQHGESELLDEIVSHKPQFDRHEVHGPQELHDKGLQHVADAVALLEQKATPQEVSDYRDFVINLATKVAAAHKEHGQEISPNEQAVLDELRAKTGASAG
jgi:hypothetical protein